MSQGMFKSLTNEVGSTTTSSWGAGVIKPVETTEVAAAPKSAAVSYAAQRDDKWHTHMKKTADKLELK